MSAIIKTSSKMACPKINKGPAIMPLLELWLMVAVNNGPGIKAPDRAIINDPVNMDNKGNKFIIELSYILALI